MLHSPVGMIAREDDSEASRPPESRVRVGVFRRAGEDRQPIAVLTVSAEDGPSVRLRMHHALDAEQRAGAQELVTRVVQDLMRERGSEGPREEFVAALKQALVQAGLEPEELPEGDVRTEVMQDHEGRAVGVERPLHAFVEPHESLASEVAARIADVFRRPPDELTAHIERLVAEGRHSEAALAMRDPAEFHAFGPPDAKLLRALRSIDASALGAEDRRELLRSRWKVACAVHEFKVAAEDAAALLQDGGEATPDERANLKMTLGLAAAESGRHETAITIFRGLLAEPSALPHSTRGWAYRNLALSLDPESPEFVRCCRLSSDAFLAAGQRVDAASSLIIVAEHRLYEETDEALAIWEELEAWFDASDPRSRELRASLAHMRGVRLLRLHQVEDALQAARRAVELRRGLLLVEPQLASSLHLASIAAGKLNLAQESAQYAREAEELEDRIDAGEPSLRRRVIGLAKRYDAQEAEAVLTLARRGDEPGLVAYALVSKSQGEAELSDAERLDLLEEALEWSGRDGSSDSDRAHVYLAMALELTRQGEYTRAIPWYEKTLAIEPLLQVARQNYLSLLWELKRWREAAAFSARQLEKFGETASLLYVCGRSYAEAGEPTAALSYLRRARRLAADEEELRLAVDTWIDRALDAGGTVSAEDPAEGASQSPVERRQFEASLEEFGAFIQASMRPSFWRAHEGKGHAWIASPEAHASALLQVFLKGKFGARIEILREIGLGAGRADLLLRFRGGLSLVVELKMCGEGYSSTYALGGTEQVVHYLDNQGTNLGYLVVFDARRRDFAQGIERVSRIGPHTVITVFTDVRMEVKGAARPR